VKIRPKPAKSPSEEAYALFSSYIGFYTHDEGFQQALDRFREQQAGRLASMFDGYDLEDSDFDINALLDELDTAGMIGEDARALSAAFRTLSRDFGFDRIRPERTAHGAWLPSAGERLLFEWCVGRPASIAVFAVDEHSEIRSYVRQDHESERLPRGLALEIQRPDIPTTFPISTTGEWDPRSEKMVDARKRILRQIGKRLDPELNAIAERAEAAGYHFADTTTNTLRDLGWLYEHVAHHKSYQEIGDSNPGGWVAGSSVSDAITPYARQLGIRHRRS